MKFAVFFIIFCALFCFFANCEPQRARTTTKVQRFTTTPRQKVSNNRLAGIICYFVRNGRWPSYPRNWRTFVVEYARQVFSLSDSRIRRFCRQVFQANYFNWPIVIEPPRNNRNGRRTRTTQGRFTRPTRFSTSVFFPTIGPRSTSSNFFPTYPTFSTFSTNSYTLPSSTFSPFISSTPSTISSTFNNFPTIPLSLNTRPLITFPIFTTPSTTTQFLTSTVSSSSSISSTSSTTVAPTISSTSLRTILPTLSTSTTTTQAPAQSASGSGSYSGSYSGSSSGSYSGSASGSASASLTGKQSQNLIQFPNDSGIRSFRKAKNGDVIVKWLPGRIKLRQIDF